MISRLLTALPAVALLALAVASPLTAEADPASVTWAVQPADAQGADGRRHLELELAPGARATEHFVVRNLSDEPVTFAINAADGYFTGTGRFNTLPSEQESVAAGTWLTVPAEVSVPAQGQSVLPVSIEVPANAEPGDHAAGISASVTTTQADGQGNQLGVESRVGFRTMIRVTGEIAPALELATASFSYRPALSPFSPGSATLTFVARNTGNATLTLAGTVEAGGGSAPVPAADAPAVTLLPGDSRRITTVVDDVWGWFHLRGGVRLEATLSDGFTFTPEPLQAATAAVPVPQLGVLAAVALLGLAWYAQRLHSRNRMRQLLEAAREAGRREAAQ